MADPVAVQTQPLDRDQLNKLAGGDFRSMKFLENLGADVSETLPDAAQASMAAAEAAQQDAADAQTAAGVAQVAADAAQSSADDAQADASSALTQITTFSAIPFVVLSASSDLTNERTLTQGSNITINDGGAGAPVTVALAQNPAIEDGQGNVAIEVSDDGVNAQIGIFGAPPTLQPNAAIAPAAFVAGAGAAVNDASTFDGYTLGQVVAALRALGILA